MLADLLQAVLALPVTEKDIRVINPIFAANRKGDKLSSLDVKVQTRQYGVIDVEIQVENYDDLWKCFQYYTARMYVDQMRSGDDYTKLTRAISIIIADFSFFTGDAAYHHRFRLFDEKNSVEYPCSIEINILEIPKRRGDNSKVSHWLEFFAARTEEEFMQLAQNNPTMEQAWGVIMQLSADEQERAEAEAAEKARRDMVARIRSAEKKGREQGLAEGRMAIVDYMLGQGHTADEISATIGLPLEEVLALIAKLQQAQ